MWRFHLCLLQGWDCAWILALPPLCACHCHLLLLPLSPPCSCHCHPCAPERAPAGNHPRAAWAGSGQTLTPQHSDLEGWKCSPSCSPAPQGILSSARTSPATRTPQELAQARGRSQAPQIHPHPKGFQSSKLSPHSQLPTSCLCGCDWESKQCPCPSNSTRFAPSIPLILLLIHLSDPAAPSIPLIDLLIHLSDLSDPAAPSHLALPNPAQLQPSSEGQGAFSCLSFLASLLLPPISSFAKQCNFTARLPRSQEIRLV